MTDQPDEPLPPEPLPPEPLPAEPLPAETPWQRLDPRMLVVEPVRELRRFLPLIIGAVLAGGAMRGDGPGGLGFELLAFVAPVVLGVLRYLTTRYRLHDGRVELRRGLLQKSLRATQLDRVRTVDLTSSLVQRVLGLSTVRIGTGAGDGDLDLDGLPTAQARDLRVSLLRQAPAAPDPADARPTGPHPAGGGSGPAPGAGHDDGPPPGQAAPAERVVLRLDPSWVRYAPLTSAGIAAAGALLAVVSQVVPDSAWRADRLAGAVPDDAGPGWLWVVLLVVGLLGVALVSSVLAVGGYLLANWDLTLTRTPTQWRLSRGLTTTRETSVDDARLAGVSVDEPLGLRLVGAASLAAVVTGLGGEGKGTLVLVPPAPAATVSGVAAEVLGVPGPAYAGLRGHGRAATRRRWLRALGPALALVAALGVLVALEVLPPAWLLLSAPLLLGGAALAADRSRGLGHALADGHVVARSGSLLRRREALAGSHVIGWTVRDTWFQRRQGLVTLEATTAGGRQRVQVLDVPEADALALAEAAVPGLVAPFLTGGRPR